MTDEAANGVEKLKRFRSPPYPMFDLGRAIERVSQVHSNESSHTVGVTVLAEAWGMKSADGKVWRTAASLIQYGLMTDSGTGKARKFQVTDAARRIILDTDLTSEKRKDAIRKAAMGPMIYRELWEKFGDASQISDTVIRTHLTIDREDSGEAPYSPSAAEEVIATYRSTITFAGLSDGDKVSSADADTPKNVDSHVPPLKNVAVGDWVKWESNGVVQFEAKRVDWISGDGSHLRVFGSPTGIPMDQIEKVEAPMAKPIAHQSPAEAVTPALKSADAGKKLDATLYVENGRLKLTADVGVDEIEDLRTVLLKYADILKLLS